jgi:hypothetical protein
MSDKFVTSAETANLTEPKSVFQMQNEISDNLNKFQIRYGRYLRCQNEITAKNVTDPPCDLNTTDSFSELKNAYEVLYKSMESAETVYADQSTKDGVTNSAYSENKRILEEESKNVAELQERLDAKLRYIQEQLKNDDQNSSFRMLESRQLINTLLIIIICCIIYYAIFEL